MGPSRERMSQGEGTECAKAQRQCCALHVGRTARLMAQQSRIHLPMQEMWFQSLGWEDLLGKEMPTHFSILAREISWTEKPGAL